MHAETCQNNPFDRHNLLPVGWRNRPLSSVAAPLVDLIPGIRSCRNRYRGLPQTDDAGEFARAALAALDIDVCVDANELAQLPKTGGAVVIANHPFGALDGLVMMAQLYAIRPDVKFMANNLLERIPQLRTALLPVDILDIKDGSRSNISPLRRALQWVKNGGMLVIFPAGEVAHLEMQRKAVVDPPWAPSVARLIQLSQAPVFPAFFSGRNSRAFQALGLLHPLLRTILLPRELINKCGTQVRLRFGAGIRPKRFARYNNPQQLIDYLRLQTFLLEKPQQPMLAKPGGETPMAPLVKAVPAPSLQLELSTLPEDQCLVQTGNMQVWHADALQIPLLLTEIGRLREETFRQVGEGTGKSIDLDRYDEHYRHLFVWNRDNAEVVGAYRLGATDEVLFRYGTAGLYTHELFDYQPDFFCQMRPALELGRSFVRSQYQRSFTPLLLLWQGIGQFLVRNPRYRCLIGPVSISSDYSDISRRILANALWEKLKEPQLAALVTPRTPFPVDFPRMTQCSLESARALLTDIDDVDALIDDLEPLQRGIPVLLRHYLNLGGKVLAMNLDHNFQSAIDALVKVDLDEAPTKVLQRYLGREGLTQFRHYRQPATRTETTAKGDTP